jgi:hypothetical protein
MVEGMELLRCLSMRPEEPGLECDRERICGSAGEISCAGHKAGVCGAQGGTGMKLWAAGVAADADPPAPCPCAPSGVWLPVRGVFAEPGPPGVTDGACIALACGAPSAKLAPTRLLPRTPPPLAPLPLTPRTSHLAWQAHHLASLAPALA